MAGQKQGVRWLLAAAVAVALSGCVSVPDAIKGTSPTPQQDLVRVMNAPQLYVGQEARFGGKVVNVQNQQGKTRLEIATVPLDSGARPELGEPSRGRIFADVNGFLDPVDFRGQLLTFACMWLLRKKVNPLWIIVGFFVIGIAGYAVGLLGL